MLPQSSSFIHWIQVELEFGNVGVCGGKRTGVHGGKPSEQGRGKPTTNSTHIWHQHQELNPGYIDGRRVLSQLHHPYFPNNDGFMRWGEGELVGFVILEKECNGKVSNGIG